MLIQQFLHGHVCWRAPLEYQYIFLVADMALSCRVEIIRTICLTVTSHVDEAVSTQRISTYIPLDHVSPPHASEWESGGIHHLCIILRSELTRQARSVTTALQSSYRVQSTGGGGGGRPPQDFFGIKI